MKVKSIFALSSFLCLFLVSVASANPIPNITAKGAIVIEATTERLEASRLGAGLQVALA